ncbi:SEL1-like repeat protein, partial [Escherichia coli]|nr:SEL1-like repeat protein [Escherichia coli]
LFFHRHSPYFQTVPECNHQMDHITAPSFVALGDIYSLGLGVEKNPQLAEKWYKKAIDATNTQHNQEINH